MFSSYFQYISLIQYAQKYIILVGAHKLQKHSLQNEKCFTVVLLSLVLHSHNYSPYLYSNSDDKKKNIS